MRLTSRAKRSMTKPEPTAKRFDLQAAAREYVVSLQMVQYQLNVPALTTNFGVVEREREVVRSATSCYPSGSTQNSLDPAISKVPLRERSAGSGLQVAFEAGGRVRIREREGHKERPGAMVNRDARRTVVVPLQTASDVTREAHVVALGMCVAAENVDEAAWFHAADLAGTVPAVGARERARRSVSPSKRCRFCAIVRAGTVRKVR